MKKSKYQSNRDKSFKHTFRGTQSKVRKKKGSFGESGHIGGWKWNIHQHIESSVKTIDLKDIEYSRTEETLDIFFRMCIKNNEIPFRVITHKNVDKEIILRRVIKEYGKKSFVLNSQNLGCITII